MSLAIDLYERHFVANNFERLDLFQQIAEQFPVERALYAGSFVHVTPSFVFPEVVYVDSDKRAKRFFADSNVATFVEQYKQYAQEPTIVFYGADYREPLREADSSADLLISQYAGFVGQHCKRYLKSGGLLLANNSHGDAGVAAVDPDYRLVAVGHLRGGKYRLSEKGLDAYFVPKGESADTTRETLLALGKGIGYKKTANIYLFRKL